VPQEADTHPMMEERCAAPLRGAELSAPGGAGPGHNRPVTQVRGRAAESRRELLIVLMVSERHGTNYPLPSITNQVRR
jgi:hypothetical protein